MGEKESFFSVSLKAFLKAFFVVVGLMAALFALVLFFSLFGSNESEEVTPKTKATVLFNPDGTRAPLKTDSDLILQINFNGVVGLGELSIDKIRTLLDESQSKPLKKGRVKAVLLNINSPGGGAFDSDGIYRLVAEYKKKYGIPIYAYTDKILASGGYYIAVAADKIYASNVAIIGSVGVMVPTIFNISKLLDKFDIESFTLIDGKYKDALNPVRPWTEEDKEYLKPMIGYFYDTFISVVAENRPLLTKEVLTNVTGAKVFAPPMAKEMGYVDEIVPTQAQAIEALAAAANLTESKYQVVTLEQTNWLTELLTEEATTLFSHFTNWFWYNL